MSIQYAAIFVVAPGLEELKHFFSIYFAVYPRQRLLPLLSFH